MSMAHPPPCSGQVIQDREQTIGVGRRANAHNICLLVDYVVEETGILMGETVVILLPHVCGEQVVQ